MRFTISGFGGASQEGQETPAAREAEPVSAAPRKSAVAGLFSGDRKVARPITTTGST